MLILLCICGPLKRILHYEFMEVQKVEKRTLAVVAVTILISLQHMIRKVLKKEYSEVTIKYATSRISFFANKLCQNKLFPFCKR
jgi:hypothetical protein